MPPYAPAPVPPDEAPDLLLESPRIAVRRHARAARLTVGALASFVACVGVGALVGVTSAGVVAAVTSAIALLIAARVTASGRGATAGTLTIRRDGMHVARGDERVALPVGEVGAGWVVPGASGASVEFLQGNGDVWSVALPSSEVGHAALAAAGIDHRKRAVRILLGGRWDGLGYGIATVLFVLLQGAPMFVLFVLLAHLDAVATTALAVGLLAAASLLGARLLGPAEVTVGADGVSWKRGFSHGFVAFRELASVSTWHGNDIALRKHSGAMVLITHSRRDPARAAGVVELIRAAMIRASDGGSATLSLLGREGRSVDAWREALRALVQGGAYRVAGLTRDDLERALSNPEVTSEQRLGAAMALMATGAPESATRVRVAADACADDSLRAALHEIAHDEYDEHTLTLAARRS